MLWPRKKIDLMGGQFGKWTVIAPAPNSGRQTRWLARCACGKERRVLTSNLRGGTSKSCGGCEPHQRPRYKHGGRTQRLYRIWQSLITRAPVIDPKVLEIYRGVGTRDPEWGDYFKFSEWARLHGYEDSLSIDRIDNALGYWPSNCRWVTLTDQQHNKSTNVMVTAHGETLTLTRMARKHGMDPATVSRRLKLGWKPEDALRKMSAKQSSAMTAACSEKG